MIFISFWHLAALQLFNISTILDSSLPVNAAKKISTGSLCMSVAKDNFPYCSVFALIC